jgi:hypothetical protein
MNNATHASRRPEAPPASGWPGSRNLPTFGQIVVIQGAGSAESNLRPVFRQPIKCKILRAKAIHSRTVRMRALRKPKAGYANAHPAPKSAPTKKKAAKKKA